MLTCPIISPLLVNYIDVYIQYPTRSYAHYITYRQYTSQGNYFVAFLEDEKELLGLSGTCLGIFVKNFVLYVYEYLAYFKCIYVYMCTTCMPGIIGGQKRALDPLELGYRGLWVSLWVLGTEPVPFKRAVHILNCWVISPVPRYIF